MSCMIAMLPGGSPELFPIHQTLFQSMHTDGNRLMTSLAAIQAANLKVEQYVGAALRPDSTPFYLTVLAPDIDDSRTNLWHAAFYAPFGVGEILGTVVGDPTDQPFMTLTIRAQLLVGGNEHASAEWEVLGSQNTTPNKSALIRRIDIINSGPHNPDDVRRCLALHGPQRVFGEPRAIAAMQCGVAAAALIEAIC